MTLLTILTELAAIAEKFDGVEVPEELERSITKLRKKIPFLKKRAQKYDTAAHRQ